MSFWNILSGDAAFPYLVLQFNFCFETRPSKLSAVGKAFRIIDCSWGKGGRGHSSKWEKNCRERGLPDQQKFNSVGIQIYIYIYIYFTGDPNNIHSGSKFRSYQNSHFYLTIN